MFAESLFIAWSQKPINFDKGVCEFSFAIYFLPAGCYTGRRKTVNWIFKEILFMKKIMFRNSLMLLSIALFVLAGLKIMPVYAFWPAIILLVVGFIMATIGFFSKDS